MTTTRLRVLSLVGAAALFACSGTGARSTATSSAGTISTGTHAGATSSAAGTGAGGAVTSSGTGAHTGSGTGGAGGGPIFDLDGGMDAPSACQHLNIGILGNPGADPSANFQQWLVMAGTSVQRIQTTGAAPTLTAATLMPFDVIILDWLTRDYTTSEAAVVTAFVNGGGGLVSMSGYDNNPADDWHANSLIAPLEVAYTGSVMNGPVTMFATHPITAGLTSVTFNGGYTIADLGGTASTRTPIAFLNNTNVGYAIQMGKGHAFVWGDEWIEFDSEWSTIPQIKQLWVQIFAWISPMNKCALMPPT